MPIPYSGNLLKNPSAADDLTHWDDVNNVTAVDGGVDDYDGTPRCFKFEPSASMAQTVNIAGLPPDIRLGGYFLPGRDVSSAAAVKVQIICTLHYADGTVGRHVLPAKSFLWGVFG